MARKLEIEVKVGVFVTIGVILTLLAILVLGNTESFLARKDHYVSHLTTAEGLISGARVMLGGIPVGTVETLRFDGEHHDVEVRFSVERDSAQWIREDSSMEVLTQGMLGDKYISLDAGSPDKPQIPDGGSVPSHAAKDFSQFLSKGDQLMLTLNTISGDLDRILQAFDRDGRADTFFQGMAETSKGMSLLTQRLNKQFDEIQLKSAIHNLNGIFEKVNNGTGTLGALINDPALYDNVKALVGGANRNRIIRNLVRKTVESGIETDTGEGPGPGPSPFPRKQ